MRRTIITVALGATIAAGALTGVASADQVTTAWTEYAANPVFSPTGRAYYPTIVKEAGTYHMWYDTASSLNYATSTDGINWSIGGSTSGLTNARHSVVKKIGDSYRIWYWDSAQLYSINAMRTATSTDGLTWTGDQAFTQVGSSVIVGGSNVQDWNRGSYGPSDVLFNPDGSDTIVAPVDYDSVWANKYVLYYDGTTGGAQSTGLAVSSDGIHWQGYNGGVAPVLAGTGVSGDWDYNYTTAATIIQESDDAFHMWYSGGNGRADHGIGYAFSADGIHWQRADDPIFHKDDGVAWRSNRTYTPVVIGDEMWFTGVDAGGNYRLGYAVAVPEPGTLALLVMGGLGALACARRRRRVGD